MNKLYLFLIPATLLLSCSSGLRVEKRHYRSGIYISGRGHYGKAPERMVMNPVCETEISPGTTSATTEKDSLPAAEDLQTCLAEEFTIADTVVPDSPQEIVAPVQPEKSKEKYVHRFNGPVEARGMNTMLLIAFGLLVLGVICTVVAFAPFLYFIGPIAAAAPFLILGAVVLSAIVASKARTRSNHYAGQDPETSVFYDKMRIKALAVLWISGIIAVAFVIGIVAVLILLSGL